jgi:iron complex transport system permease protein
MKNRAYYNLIFGIIGIALLLLFVVNISLGSVSIPFCEVISILLGQSSGESVNELIVLKSRLPQSLTAILAGSALSLCGLIMQTYFRNPLADPSVLGISAGSSLGVAILFMFPAFISLSASNSGFVWQNASIIVASLIGATVVLVLIIIFSGFVRNHVMLLVLGIMISAIAGSFIGILSVFNVSENVHAYAIWGLGSFSMVTMEHMKFFAPMVVLGLIFSVGLMKPLNVLLLGEKQAVNLGVNIKSVRLKILIIVGFLTAIITAYCGPIAFLGLAIPHMSRLLFKTSNHAVLIPASVLLGALLALLCTLISKLPGLNNALPINAITSLFGAPIVIWIILKRTNSEKT